MKNNIYGKAPPSQAWWRGDLFAGKRPALQIRGAVTRATRQFFEDQGFAEVETPILQISPGLEPHLFAFKTQFDSPADTPSQPLYLHTSPEFTMKKLLAAGEEKIWQLAKVFRNREQSARHQPEFSMIEWYRAGAGYEDLMTDCEALVQAAARAAGCTGFRYKGLPSDPFAPWRRVTVADAFQSYAGIDLLSLLDNRAGLAAAAQKAGVRVAADESWDDIVLHVLADKVEPFLGTPTPTFLVDYPISLAALARPKPSDPRFAERFELYASGLELANAFGELTDPVLQRTRFAADMALKQQLYGDVYPIDEDFLDALAFVPPSAGIALGFDRLVMLCAGKEAIDDVMWAVVDTVDFKRKV
jgi:elongation factor P--(R)-beta-lysine ligase